MSNLLLVKGVVFVCLQLKISLQHISQLLNCREGGVCNLLNNKLLKINCKIAANIFGIYSIILYICNGNQTRHTPGNGIGVLMGSLAIIKKKEINGEEKESVLEVAAAIFVVGGSVRKAKE